MEGGEEEERLSVASRCTPKMIAQVFGAAIAVACVLLVSVLLTSSAPAPVTTTPPPQGGLSAAEAPPPLLINSSHTEYIENSTHTRVDHFFYYTCNMTECTAAAAAYVADHASFHNSTTVAPLPPPSYTNVTLITVDRVEVNTELVVPHASIEAVSCGTIDVAGRVRAQELRIEPEFARSYGDNETNNETMTRRNLFGGEGEEANANGGSLSSSGAIQWFLQYTEVVSLANESLKVVVTRIGDVCTLTLDRLMISSSGNVANSQKAIDLPSLEITSAGPINSLDRCQCSWSAAATSHKLGMLEARQNTLLPLKCAGYSAGIPSGKRYLLGHPVPSHIFLVRSLSRVSMEHTTACYVCEDPVAFKCGNPECSRYLCQFHAICGTYCSKTHCSHEESFVRVDFGPLELVFDGVPDAILDVISHDVVNSFQLNSSGSARLVSIGNEHFEGHVVYHRDSNRISRDCSSKLCTVILGRVDTAFKISMEETWKIDLTEFKPEGVLLTS